MWLLHEQAAVRPQEERQRMCFSAMVRIRFDQFGNNKAFCVEKYLISCLYHAYICVWTHVCKYLLESKYKQGAFSKSYKNLI